MKILKRIFPFYYNRQYQKECERLRKSATPVEECPPLLISHVFNWTVEETFYWKQRRIKRENKAREKYMKKKKILKELSLENNLEYIYDEFMKGELRERELAKIFLEEKIPIEKINIMINLLQKYKE